MILPSPMPLIFASLDLLTSRVRTTPLLEGTTL